jgi:hypothetical protein
LYYGISSSPTELKSYYTLFTCGYQNRPKLSSWKLQVHDYR